MLACKEGEGERILLHAGRACRLRPCVCVSACVCARACMRVCVRVRERVLEFQVWKLLVGMVEMERQDRPKDAVSVSSAGLGRFGGGLDLLPPLGGRAERL